MKRTPQQVGDILRRRREQLGRRQDRLVFVSAATARKIEQGTQQSFDAKSLTGYARAVRWPHDAYERLRNGEDPVVLPHVPDPDYDVPESSVTAALWEWLKAQPTNADLEKKLDEIREMVRALGSNTSGRHRSGHAASDGTPSSGMPRPAIRRDR